MEMAANFLVILVELDRGARARALRHSVARFVVLGTIALVMLAQLTFVASLLSPFPEGCGKTSGAYDDVMTVVKLTEQFQIMNHDRCPRDMGELITAGVMRRPMKDPWNRPLVFKCSAAGIRVCSLGPNQFETADDICSDDG